MKTKEYRSFDFEVREMDGERPKIVGYAAVFDHEASIYGSREVVRKGAFTKTIQEADIRALFNHDKNYVLGRNTAGTLQLSEDDTGLRIEIDPPDTQLVRDMVIAPMRRGDIDQMSFGFQVIKDKVSGAGKDLLRELTEVKLFDISPVTFPAYPQTSVGVRSLDMDIIDNVLKRVENKEELDSWDESYILRAIEILRSCLPAEPEVNHSEETAEEDEPTVSHSPTTLLRERIRIAESEIIQGANK